MPVPIRPLTRVSGALIKDGTVLSQDLAERQVGIREINATGAPNVGDSLFVSPSGGLVYAPGGSGAGGQPAVGVYPTLADRPTTAPGGAIAFVEDVGNGEWGMYVFATPAIGWVKTASQDSARTDADTIQLILTPADGAETLIGTLSRNSRVTLVTVEVTEVFNTSAELSIGIDSDNEFLMSDGLIDLSTIGVYISQSEKLINPSQYGDDIIQDTDIFAYLDNPGVNGRAVINITYV